MALTKRAQELYNKICIMHDQCKSGIEPKALRSMFYELYMHGVIDMYLKTGRLISIGDLVRFKNLIPLIQSKYPEMDEEIIIALAKNNLGGSVSVGEGENILVLLGSNGRFVVEGDVSIDNIVLEVKCGGGHMCGQGITVGDINAYHFNGVDALKKAGFSKHTQEWDGDIIVGRIIKDVWKHNPAALQGIIFAKCFGLYGMQAEAEIITEILMEKLTEALTPKVIGTYKRSSGEHKKGDPKYRNILDKEIGKVYIHYFGIWQAYMYTKLSGVNFLLLFNKQFDYMLFGNDGDFDNFLLNMTDYVDCYRGPKLYDNMCKATVVALK